MLIVRGIRIGGENTLLSLRLATIMTFLLCFLAFNASKGKEAGSHVFSLDEAIDRALEYNEGIMAAKDGIGETEAGVTVARSGFLPSISAQGSYTRLSEVTSLEMSAPVYGMLEVPVFGLTGDTIGSTVVPGVVGTENVISQMGEKENYLARLSLEQALFTWGKTLNSYQISKLNVHATEEDYRRDVNELIFSVTEAFYSILVLEELVKVNEDSYKQIECHADVTQKRYDEGLESKYDLLRTQVELTNMEPQVLKAKNSLKTAKMGFKVLLGLPQDEAVELRGELDYEPIEISLEESISKAQIARPEIRSASLRRQMASKSLAIARRANYPNLVFTANYDYKKPLYYENEWGSDWNIAFVLQMPLFTGLENHGRVQQARYQLSKAEHSLSLLMESVEMEVRASYLQLEEAKKLIDSQKENIVQAEKVLEIAEESYRQGLATSLEVRDAQVALTQAKINWFQALSEYLIAKAEIEKSIGM
jgi:outer membrane protein